MSLLVYSWMGGEMPLRRSRIFAPAPAAAGWAAGFGASAGLSAGLAAAVAGAAGAVVGGAAGFGTSVGREGVPQAASRAAPPNAASPPRNRRRLVELRGSVILFFPLTSLWVRDDV